MLLLVALQRFSEDADILVDAVKAKFGLESAPEYVWFMLWSILNAHDLSILLWWPCRLELMIAGLVEVSRAFGLLGIVENTGTVCVYIPIPHDDFVVCTPLYEGAVGENSLSPVLPRAYYLARIDGN